MSAARFPVQRHDWMQVPCEPADDILVIFGDSQSFGHNPVMHSLTTEQLVLRPPEDSDFEVYKSFFSNREASRYYGGPLRPDQAWRVLASHLGHWQLRGYGMWMIVPGESGEPVGGCGFVWPEGWPRRELTWWLMPEARGRGIAVEASRTAIRHAYDHYGWPRAETHMSDDNIAAKRLVQKLDGTEIAREIFPDGETRTVYELPRPD
ncbi:MAG: GNAT family N-acetyltransferase [Roseibium album]|uniref:GNAT family N-acetyltransferase n=1 Tax=Roseibium album TaxID=311410 RepID=UPI001A33C600|nr:GNAT family N-acetyltransferase [Roseibium album]MBG6200037.1 RimJ/RimL family protein N-acetyltransferase [Labrenzia sp. EL_13]MCR9057227.1 GNAT family N-acetyltransferase [Paracoccaceae bacterium]